MSNYENYMKSYYNYASQTNTNSNTQLVMKTIKKITYYLLLITLLVVAFYSSITMYLLSSTSDELPLTQDGYDLYNYCKYSLFISIFFLFIYWLKYELDNAQEEE